MRCPSCTHPMHLGRQESGIEVWHCSRCRASKRKRTSGYTGSLVMGAWVPKRRQERE